MRVFNVLSLLVIAGGTAICPSTSHASDELSRLVVEASRAWESSEIPVGTATARFESLLQRFTDQTEQGAIYYKWIVTNACTGMKDPRALCKHAEIAMTLPLSPDERLQVCIYWGDALQTVHAGVKGAALDEIRATVVAPYLKGLAEACAVRDVMKRPQPPRPPTEDEATNSRGNQFPAPGRISSEDHEWIRRCDHFDQCVIVLEDQIARVYGTMPFKVEEIESLATTAIPEAEQRGRLLKKVHAAVAARRVKFEGDALRRKVVATRRKGSSENMWQYVGGVSLVVVVASGLLWSRRR